ncbi:MAG: hypothetical protein JNK72_19705 [Myxococcales bacterium]|nr:hypothetical protein [Myxococcales bacterium]
MAAQTFAVTVPHATSQLALGRCACPDGASLTTVGSILVDAAATLTAQSKGDFTAQTNATMSWLSAAGTKAHAQAKVEIYSGGGVAPGPCGSGAPAPSPGTTSPAASTEKMVNVTLSGASLLRNAYEIKNADSALATASQVLDGVKNAAELGNEFVENETAKSVIAGIAGVAEAGSGVTGAIGGVKSASGGIDKIAALAGGGATVASGGAGVAAAAAGGSVDIEERSAAEIKMVAGKKISATAGVGFDYKTLNKFGVTAALVTDFTTITWAAFCLLKFEVKSFSKVKIGTTMWEVKASTKADLTAGATITLKAPTLKYVGRVKMTKWLLVRDNTDIKNGLSVSKDTELKANLTVHGDFITKQKIEVKGDLNGRSKLNKTERKRVNGDLTQMAKATLA